MGNKLSSLESPVVDKSKREDDSYDREQNTFNTEQNTFNTEQKKAFDTMINEKIHILYREANLVNKEIRKLELEQLSKGGNRVITDNILLERIVKYHEELDRLSKLKIKYVFNSHYEDGLRDLT